jgi:hypothetical protein
MKRAPLRRRTPLRRSAGPPRRTQLQRTTPLRPGPWRKPPGDGQAGQRRPPFGASEAQRRKIVGGACVVCQQTKSITPAHLAPRSLGGCDHPDCVVPLCWLHHRAYDTGRLELLAYLEPRWRNEIAHAVLHLGLIAAVRRLRGRRAG